VRTRGRANLSTEHIAATIKDRVGADARQQAETTKTKAERKRAEREAAAARAAAQRARAAERAEAARIAKLERRARRLMDEIRAETPPAMLAAALAAKHGLTVTATGEHDAPSRWRGTAVPSVFRTSSVARDGPGFARRVGRATNRRWRQLGIAVQNTKDSSSIRLDG